jgi:hypothetical protein
MTDAVARAFQALETHRRALMMMSLREVFAESTART